MNPKDTKEIAESLRRYDLAQGEPPVRSSEIVMPHDLHGGKWLAAAREWLQWNTINGDSVTWGSDDVLRPNMTVKMVEEMAARIAAAAINEERERVRHNVKVSNTAGRKE